MSDSWMRKIATYFNTIDFDKDGSITLSDFEGMAQRVMETLKQSDDWKEDAMKRMKVVSSII